MKRSHFLVGSSSTMDVLVAGYIADLPGYITAYGLTMVWLTIILIWLAERGERQ